MVLKYDFNITNTGNPYVDSLIYTNTNSYGLVVYGLVLFFLGVLVYTYIRKTSDISLSFQLAFFASTIISTIFYYLGVFVGVSLFNGELLIAMVLLNIAGAAFTKFMKNKLNE